MNSFLIYSFKALLLLGGFLAGCGGKTVPCGWCSSAPPLCDLHSAIEDRPVVWISLPRPTPSVDPEQDWFTCQCQSLSEGGFYPFIAYLDTVYEDIDVSSGGYRQGMATKFTPQNENATVGVTCPANSGLYCDIRGLSEVAWPQNGLISFTGEWECLSEMRDHYPGPHTADASKLIDVQRAQSTTSAVGVYTFQSQEGYSALFDEHVDPAADSFTDLDPAANSFTDLCEGIYCKFGEICFQGRCQDVPHPKPKPDLKKWKNFKTRIRPKKCFPAFATVQLMDGITKRMDEIKTGDRVLSIQEDKQDDGSMSITLEFAHVIYLPHLSNTVEASFLEIACKTPNGDLHSLQATPEHFLFLAPTTLGDTNDNNDHLQALPAKDVAIGDLLWRVTAKGMMTQSPEESSLSSPIETCQVTSIHTMKQKGVYSAFTTSGRLVVDGFVASSYAASSDGTGWINYDHTWAHRACGTLHGWAYTLGISDWLAFRWWNDSILAPLFA